MKKISLIIISVLLSFTCFTGCSTSQTADNGKINIVATIFPEYDFAKAIAGDKANVTMLTKPGASVHAFDPSPADIAAVKDADVFIYIGGESDVWVDTILDSLGASKTKVIRLMDYVNTVQEEIKEGMEDEHGEDEHASEEDENTAKDHEEEQEPETDEHIWISPKNAMKLIDAILAGICEKDRKNQDFYTKNADAYKTELVKVDHEIADIVATAKRKFIVVADKFPFRYFADDYGLDYAAAFPGCSDQTDASVQTIAYLVNSVKTQNIRYIYHVELSNQSTAEVIAEQTGAQALLLNSCHNISKADFDGNVTYVDIMKQNAENLRKGLN